MTRIVLSIIVCFTLPHYVLACSIETAILEDSVEMVDYYKNGNKKLVGFYKFKALNENGDSVFYAVGKQIKYYESGTIEGYSYFKDGELDGESVRYSKQGAIVEKMFFVKGKLEGPYVFYYPDGKIQREGQFKNDKDYGLSRKYFPNGKIALEEYYNEEGIQEGEVKFYNRKGEILRKEFMYNGKQTK